MQWSMGVNCGTRSARRLLLLTAVAALGSLTLSAPAFAQGGLGSITSAVLPKTGTSLDKAVDDNLEAAAPILDTASPVIDAAAPVVETAAPVVQAADPVVQKTATPVLRSAAPVLDAAAPVLETTAPVVQAASTAVAPVTQPVSDVTASALGTVDEVVQAAPPAVGSAQDDATPPSPNTISAGGVQMPEVSSEGEASADTRLLGGSRNNVPATLWRLRDLTRRAGSSAPHWQSSPPTTWASDPWSPVLDASDSRPAMSARAPGAPSRHGPSVPATPSSISAGSFGGGALLVLAALAALLLLAAPGMSRRLRLMLAFPPLPVALSPLERPG
jgi:hypothetical protein